MQRHYSTVHATEIQLGIGKVREAMADSVELEAQEMAGSVELVELEAQEAKVKAS